jgi:hypothetical protein
VLTIFTLKDTRAREEIRALVRRRECDLFWDDSEAFLCFLLLAQEGEPLLFRIHGNDHKQTKQQKEEKNHVHRIAWTLKSVLYSGFANAKQLCKHQIADISRTVNESFHER